MQAALLRSRTARMDISWNGCMSASEREMVEMRQKPASLLRKMKLMNARDCNKTVHFESPVRFLAWLSIVFIPRGLWRWFLSCVLHLRRRAESHRRVNALLFKEEGSLVRVFFPESLPPSLPHMFCTLPSSSRGKSVRPPEVASSLI